MNYGNSCLLNRSKVAVFCEQLCFENNVLFVTGIIYSFEVNCLHVVAFYCLLNTMMITKVMFFQASTTKSSKKVPLFFYTLYIEGEGSGGAGEGEAIVRVNILDVNDNAPVFDNASTEIIASVPTTAEYGHPVTKIQVIDWKFLVLFRIFFGIWLSHFWMA